jgi:hypothetical protein
MCKEGKVDSAVNTVNLGMVVWAGLEDRATYGMFPEHNLTGYPLTTIGPKNTQTQCPLMPDPEVRMAATARLV